MFRGSPGLSAGQLANLSAAIGGDYNADTQQMLTQYFFTAPAEDLDIALHIEAVRMKGILSTDELWDKERGAIEQEVAQDLSNPIYVFYTNLLELVYKGTPYARDALGSRPSFDKTTGAMLKEFHNTWYVPNNAILVICGDVDPQAAMGKVQELFGDLPAGKLPERPDVPFSADRAADDQGRYGFADRHGGDRIPAARDRQRGLRGAGSDVGRPGQHAGTVVCAGAGGKALFTELSYEPLPQAGRGICHRRISEGGRRGGVIGRDAPDPGNGNQRWPFRRIGTGREAAGSGGAGISEKLGIGTGDGMVPGAGRGRPPIAGGRHRRDPKADDRGCQPCRQGVFGFEPCDHAILSPRPSGKPISSRSFGGKESFASGEGKAYELPDWAKSAVERLDLPQSMLEPDRDSFIQRPDGRRAAGIGERLGRRVWPRQVEPGCRSGQGEGRGGRHAGAALFLWHKIARPPGVSKGAR